MDADAGVVTVVVALITAVPATIGAYAALVTARRTRTSNGRKLGEKVEDLYEMVKGHIADACAHGRCEHEEDAA